MLKLTTKLLVAVSTLVFTLSLCSSPASAHVATITSETRCLDNGDWAVDWTLHNPEKNFGVDLSNQVGVNFTPNPVLAKSTGTDTTYHSADVDVVTISVQVKWRDGFAPDNPIYMAKAYRPTKCCPPTTTTTVPTTTTQPTTTTTQPTTTTTEPTTTTSTTSTTIPTTTTTIPETTTTVTVPETSTTTIVVATTVPPDSGTPQLAYTGSSMLYTLLALASGLVIGGILLKRRLSVLR